MCIAVSIYIVCICFFLLWLVFFWSFPYLRYIYLQCWNILWWRQRSSWQGKLSLLLKSLLMLSLINSNLFFVDPVLNPNFLNEYPSIKFLVMGPSMQVNVHVVYWKVWTSLNFFFNYKILIGWLIKLLLLSLTKLCTSESRQKFSLFSVIFTSNISVASHFGQSHM